MVPVVVQYIALMINCIVCTLAATCKYMYLKSRVQQAKLQ